jgi:hypothetical protein
VVRYQKVFSGYCQVTFKCCIGKKRASRRVAAYNIC